jgi:hypothetical protein
MFIPNFPTFDSFLFPQQHSKFCVQSRALATHVTNFQSAGFVGPKGSGKMQNSRLLVIEEEHLKMDGDGLPGRSAKFAMAARQGTGYLRMNFEEETGEQGRVAGHGRLGSHLKFKISKIEK